MGHEAGEHRETETALLGVSWGMGRRALETETALG